MGRRDVEALSAVCAENGAETDIVWQKGSLGDGQIDLAPQQDDSAD